MQQQKYDMVVGLSEAGKRDATGRQLRPHHLAIWFIAPDGVQMQTIGGNEREEVGRALAHRGATGGEAVGLNQSWTLFKRPRQ